MSVRGPQQLRGIKRQAEKQGWTVTKTNGGHLRWMPPGGGECVISEGTRIGNSRSVQNTLARLKAKGLRL